MVIYMQYGGDKATVRITGKENKMHTLIIPCELVREMEKAEQKLEHLDRVRIWLEKTNLKAEAKPHAFKKKEGGVDTSTN